MKETFRFLEKTKKKKHIEEDYDMIKIEFLAMYLSVKEFSTDFTMFIYSFIGILTVLSSSNIGVPYVFFFTMLFLTKKSEYLALDLNY